MPTDAAPTGIQVPLRGTRCIRASHLAWVAVYSLFLLLALRSGGRTYPGWYFPDSRFLNAVLNGNALFTQAGYDAAIIGAAAAAARILFDSGTRPRLHRLLRWTQRTAIACAVLIACYGLAWAILMHRLPWQPDGASRFLG